MNEARKLSPEEIEALSTPPKKRGDQKNNEPNLIHPVSEDTVLFSEEDLKAGREEIAKNNAIKKELEKERRIKSLLIDIDLDKKNERTGEDIIGFTGSPEEQATLKNMQEKMRPHFTVEQVLQAAQKGSLSYEIMPKNIADEDVIKKAWLKAEEMVENETKNTKFLGKLKRFIGFTGETKMEKAYNELNDFVKSISTSTGHVEATQEAISSSNERNQKSGSGSANVWERKK